MIDTSELKERIEDTMKLYTSTKEGFTLQQSGCNQMTIMRFLVELGKELGKDKEKKVRTIKDVQA